MAQPADTGTFATDPGTTTEPPSGTRAGGFQIGERPPPKWHNWLWNVAGQWHEYLKNLHVETQFLNKQYSWTGAHGFSDTVGFFGQPVIGGASNELLYADDAGVVAPRTRVTLHALKGSTYVREGREEMSGVYASGAGVTLWTSGALDTSPKFRHDIELPREATLQAWRLVAFTVGATSVGRVRLFRSTPVWSPPGAPSLTAIGTMQSTTIALAEEIGEDGLSEVIVAGSAYYLEFDLSAFAADNTVTFGAVELTWLDPGPRNIGP